MKIRLDQLLVEKGLAESREQAKKLILSGNVSNRNSVLDKPGMSVDPEKTEISIKQPLKYVSRGGIKLEGFMQEIGLDVTGFKCLDVGSSTGGFTDFLLQNRAAGVVCVDVGSGLLHWKLRNDPRVQVHEKTNARFLNETNYGADFDLAVMDLSFISLKLVLAQVVPLIKKSGAVICLVKPQFEAGRKHIEKGGVVRSQEIQLQCVRDISVFAGGINLSEEVFKPCCIRGPAGNQEYFILFRKHSCTE